MSNTTIRNGKLFCLNCGGEFELKFPMPVTVISAKTKAFEMLHKDCPKTWVEPEADMNESVNERAWWWWNNGERGMSSEAMWRCFMNGINAHSPNNCPSDPDDFSRCYKLLQAVPEWKKDLYKLRDLSPAWNNLVENWDELTKMFEQNEREGWKNYKEIGMYEFMKKLIGEE